MRKTLEKWYPARDRSVYFGSVPFYRALAYRILVRGGHWYTGGYRSKRHLNYILLFAQSPPQADFFRFRFCF